MRDWALEIVDAMRGVCELLDEGDAAATLHGRARRAGGEGARASLTPSARTLHELRTNGESFFQFALRMSAVHKSYFLELYSPNEARQEEFAREAEESLREQARVEAADAHRLRRLPGALFRRLNGIRPAVRAIERTYPDARLTCHEVWSLVFDMTHARKRAATQGGDEQ